MAEDVIDIDLDDIKAVVAKGKNEVESEISESESEEEEAPKPGNIAGVVVIDVAVDIFTIVQSNGIRCFQLGIHGVHEPKLQRGYFYQFYQSCICSSLSHCFLRQINDYALVAKLPTIPAPKPLPQPGLNIMDTLMICLLICSSSPGISASSAKSHDQLRRSTQT